MLERPLNQRKWSSRRCSQYHYSLASRLSHVFAIGLLIPTPFQVNMPESRFLFRVTHPVGFSQPFVLLWTLSNRAYCLVTFRSWTFHSERCQVHLWYALQFSKGHESSRQHQLLPSHCALSSPLSEEQLAIPCPELRSVTPWDPKPPTARLTS